MVDGPGRSKTAGLESCHLQGLESPSSRKNTRYMGSYYELADFQNVESRVVRAPQYSKVLFPECSAEGFPF